MHEEGEIRRGQIVRILKEVEAGAKSAETFRRPANREPTYYVWKSKYASMEVSQLRHLKHVEAELRGSSGCTRVWRWSTTRLRDIISRKL